MALTDTYEEPTNCPKCDSDGIWRDSADVGVGIIYGPWGCPQCAWSESEEYDLSEGQNPVDEKGGVIDQYGSYHPVGSTKALAYQLAALEQEDE